jgi:hypothetical protein
MPGPKARVRKRWIVIGIALVCVAGWLHLSSPKRDLEVALGVKRLPASLTYEKVRVDSWQDYSVDAVFEVEPEDMRRLLAARPYTEVRPPLPASFFSEVSRFEVKYLFEWQPDQRDFLRCQLWVSGDFSKACLRYLAD